MRGRYSRGWGGYEGSGYSLGELEKSRCCTAWMSPIPQNTSRRDILDFFKEYQAVECRIVEKNNRFAFINFPNETLRDSAIAAKRGSTFKGVDVVVNRSFNAYEGPRLGGRTRIDEDDIWGEYREVKY
jgi:RNA recognition motif-containing protein